MKLLMRLLQEPLFHFTVIGGPIFAFYAAVDVEYPGVLAILRRIEWPAVRRIREDQSTLSVFPPATECGGVGGLKS
jgi:hypothetical protein